MDRSHKLEYRTEDEIVAMRNQRRQDQYTAIARQQLADVAARALQRQLQKNFRWKALLCLGVANTILIAYDVAVLTGWLP